MFFGSTPCPKIAPTVSKAIHLTNWHLHWVWASWMWAKWRFVNVGVGRGQPIAKKRPFAGLPPFASGKVIHADHHLTSCCLRPWIGWRIILNDDFAHKQCYKKMKIATRSCQSTWRMNAVKSPMDIVLCFPPKQRILATNTHTCAKNTCTHTHKWNKTAACLQMMCGWLRIARRASVARGCPKTWQECNQKQLWTKP